MMVEMRTLGQISRKELTATYNQAFSDYQVAVNMTEEQLGKALARNGFQKDISMGLFDGQALVGFVLNGARDNYCYDCGTAIIPSYRGKGYARLLATETLALLRDQGLHTWVLEVLSDNKRAKKLYETIGFTTQREFNCYQIQAETLIDESKATVELKRQETFFVPSGECLPSWQNTKEAILAGEVPVWDIVFSAKKVGVLSFDPLSGSIAQLYIDEQERRKGFAGQALIAAAHLCRTEFLRFINIDAGYRPLNTLLEKHSFSLFVTQDEMTRTLRTNA